MKLHTSVLIVHQTFAPQQGFPRPWSSVASYAFLAALGLALAGCASPGYQKGDTAAASLTASADKIQAAGLKVDQALNWLNDLVNRPQYDLRPQYQKFSAAVDALGVSAKEVQQSVATMSAKGNAYFAGWDKELAGISNEDIRNRSEARKADLAKAFADLKRRYVETEISFRPFLSELRDVQTALGSNLTPASVESMKGTAAKATADGAKLKAAVSGLVDEFKALGVSLSPVTKPN